MPQVNCFGAIQCVATRFAALTATGAPLTGANNGYSTSILMEATISPDVSEGDKSVLENANSNICQIFEACDILQGIEIEIEVCSLEPDLMALLAGGRTFVSSAQTRGWEFPLPSDTCKNGTCVEFWQLSWDQNTQATSTMFAANTLTYTHWVFPRVRWMLEAYTINKDFTTWKLKGKAQTNPKITANGPYDDWDAPVSGMGGITGLGGFFYDDEFPATQCGLITVPSPAS